MADNQVRLPGEAGNCLFLRINSLRNYYEEVFF